MARATQTRTVYQTLFFRGQGSGSRDYIFGPVPPSAVPVPAKKLCMMSSLSRFVSRSRARAASGQWCEHEAYKTMIVVSRSRCSTYSALRAVGTRYHGTTSFFRGETICYRLYSNGGPSDGRRMNVFDRKAKRWHKNRASMSPDADTFDYLRDEVTGKQSIET